MDMKGLPGMLPVLALILAGCNAPLMDSAGTPVSPTRTAASTATASSTVGAPAPEGGVPEAIMILEPGPGSRLTSPLRVRGEADSTFEQTLVARLVDSNGNVLHQEPLMIESPLGERGPFDAELNAAVSEQTNVFLQVYATSPRDGGITHLETVGGGITLMPDGLQEIVVRDPYGERITLFEPQNGQQISAGVVHVEGYGLASFEGTLVLELYDVDGGLIGSEPIIVQSPDMGIPGTFSGDIPYSITQSMPARLVVLDPLPTANGVNHITSVEIKLQP
jgi:hypothetical protein